MEEQRNGIPDNINAKRTNHGGDYDDDDDDDDDDDGGGDDSYVDSDDGQHDVSVYCIYHASSGDLSTFYISWICQFLLSQSGFLTNQDIRISPTSRCIYSYSYSCHN